MTTSYLSPKLPSGENGGVNRGSGGAKDGRTRRSREEEEYSVKTGILMRDKHVEGGNN